MAILLAFSPFLALFLLERMVSPGVGLAAGVVAALILLLHNWKSGKTPKLLELGTFVLFAGLAVFHFATGAVWSIPATQLLVDAGLLLIVLISVAVRQPFTLQYAREQVEALIWNTSRFVRTNYVITGVWAVAFAVMVVRTC